MFFKTSLSIVAAMVFIPAQSNAAGQCPVGSSNVNVNGRVTTLNISATKQAGQICLTMVTADGREVFDDCGALVGKVTSTDTNTNTSTLNHTAVFELAESFHTMNDVAQVTGVLATDANGAPCALSVQEHINNLQWGTGIFNKATLDVTAVGSVSFCPGKNLNTFTLTGQGCVRNIRLR